MTPLNSTWAPIWKRNFLHFIELTGPLLCSQEPIFCPNTRQMNPVHAIPLYFHLNVMLPPITRSYKWPLSFRFSHQNSVCTSCLPYPHLILLDNTLTVMCTIKEDYQCAQNHSIPTTTVSALGNTHCKNLPFVFTRHFHCCWVVIRQTWLGMSTANPPFHQLGFLSITENGDKCFYSEIPCYKKIQNLIKV